MKTRLLPLLLSLVGWLALNATARAEDFQIEEVTPAKGATGVSLEPLIQLHTSDKFDPATVSEKAVQLLDQSLRPVAINVTADLGGVVTVSPASPLATNATYTIRVTRALKARDGRGLVPFTSTFHTTATPLAARAANAAFVFTKARIDQRDGVCGLALAPGHQLFACTWDGQLTRYRLGANGEHLGKVELVLHRPERRFVAMVPDPSSTADTTVLWLGHDSMSRLSLGPNDFSGTLSRVTIRGDAVTMEDVIVGLPTGDHPSSGLVFGPGGHLFISQGAMTMLGDKPELKETPLSAATLEVDLRDPRLHTGTPVNVKTDPPVSYDPASGPVTIFATGIREAYDLCWHSNGNLYAGVNMNDTKETTPAHEGLPAVNVRPTEMMLRIVRGHYYGHPNPTRNQWVLLGGNPTADIDPWEITKLPVGTMPEPNFDPNLLIRDLEADKGPSADGNVEWTKPGPLQGRLFFCFYTATRGIHTYAFSPDGASVTDHQPLLTPEGGPLTFGAPLDIAFDPRGWLYVADFSAPERGDSGKGGGVWLARPATPQ